LSWNFLYNAVGCSRAADAQDDRSVTEGLSILVGASVDEDVITGLDLIFSTTLIENRYVLICIRLRDLRLTVDIELDGLCLNLIELFNGFFCNRLTNNQFRNGETRLRFHQ